MFELTFVSILQRKVSLSSSRLQLFDCWPEAGPLLKKEKAEMASVSGLTGSPVPDWKRLLRFGNPPTSPSFRYFGAQQEYHKQQSYKIHLVDVSELTSTRSTCFFLLSHCTKAVQAVWAFFCGVSPTDRRTAFGKHQVVSSQRPAT